MTNQSRVLAAQYLRMSTDDQPSSIPIQREAIQTYATIHGFEVVATYSDPGRSGIEITNRPGLRHLIHEITGGHSKFKAILVYDVSRWGRFQDTDEAAHYEFLCRRAGIPVHYCAEQFSNDGSISSTILKTLKRTMAAEYSRELSVKVTAGLRRRANEGFRVGAAPGFGLRRMMISEDGRQKRLLQPHEHKYAHTDHVILVPGPKNEVQCVQAIFELAAKKSCTGIAVELNSRKLEYLGRPWTPYEVYRILTNRKYMGWSVWGTTHHPFGSARQKVAQETWAIKKDAFAPLVTPEQFARAQAALNTRRVRSRSDAVLLNRVKRVWKKEGRLSYELLREHGVEDFTILRTRFGSLMSVYKRIGYRAPLNAIRCSERLSKFAKLRSTLMFHLKELFPTIRLIRLSTRSRKTVLELSKSLRVAVHICSLRPATLEGEPRWRLTWNSNERGLPTLICLPDRAATVLTDYYLVPSLIPSTPNSIVLHKEHALLRNGRRLQSIDEFWDSARKMSSTSTIMPGGTVDAELAVTTDATITVADTEFTLPKTVAAIFRLLVHNTGAVVSKEKLCAVALAASPHSSDPRFRGSYLIDHIFRLRSALGELQERVLTVRGQGYMYIDRPHRREVEDENNGLSVRKHRSAWGERWPPTVVREF